MVKILVVEDERDIRELIKFILVIAGHEVIEARDGDEAIELAIQHHPDLISMDVRIPKLTGYEVTRQLAKIETTQFIPVVFVSAKGQDFEVEIGFEAGGVDYILKPFSPDYLVSRIQDILDAMSELARKLGLTEVEGRREYVRRIRQHQLNIKQWIAKYSILTTKQVVHHLVTEAPLLHIQFCEANAITSGIIHDLRNIVGVAEANIWKIPENISKEALSTKSINDLKRLHFLIEDLGELRYTNYWNPRNVSLQVLLGKFNRVKDYYPNFVVKMPKNDSKRSIYCEEHQIDQAFFNLSDLLATLSLDQQATIKEVQSNEYVIETIVDPKLDWDGISNSENCTQGNLNAIRYFIAVKLVARQGGQLIGELISNRLVLRLTLPTNTPPEPLEDAALADLDVKITAIPTHSTKSQIHLVWKLHLLFEPICGELFKIIDRAEGNLQEISPELKEEKAVLNIAHSLRFARLLVLNLLITVAGYEPQLKPLNLKSLVDLVINLLKSKMLQSVNVIFPKDLPSILADELGVMQIVLNLLTNAGEATDEEGQINVSAVDVGGRVKLEIEDSGHGIPSEVLKRIFELDYSTKSGHQRGVGLYVVKSIVDRLGATIEVISQVDKGTKFLILFPTI